MKRALLVLGLALLPATAAAQQYRFPMELPGSGTQPYVTAYRDHAGAGALEDWNCGTETYDGHKGSDFGIGSWPVMDAGSRWIVAAADGEVEFVNDGCFDKCSTGDCGCGSGFGNYVKVKHADGKSTYYAHMMTGSLVVGIGDQVTCGQHLGKVGSSGNSTGPHLHFEPRYSDNTSDDPFAGGCSGPTSFWVDQGIYQGLPGDQCENPPPPPVDDAALVSETVPAGTQVAPGAAFDKSWVLENTGNTTWTKAGGYALLHVGGDAFGAATITDLADADSVAPTQQKTWTLSLTAPAAPGTYSGDFRMDHGGTAFGPTLHVEIAVGSGGSGGTGSGGGSGSAGSGGVANGGGGLGNGPGIGGSATDGGLGGSGGSSLQNTQTTGDVEGGCACRATGTEQRESRWSALLFALVGVGLLRRAGRG